ncbi:glycosyltransferase [Rhizorhabdus dicambivorans]|uniref:Group 1 glycosyl transferase n=1 Tax=Rhizorhabdus dicambivorans TaxID=1850238 RepID=A0A2A4FPX8_9SPHN|nr:glycosyltransferase [Rhizorhabdus dicambivorans]ATE64034.1 group 1 glycosyl transferase [Rhizorhabdus dicambivorans]PCE40227.1 group 1 glycosyl transferase [Rhizorhabdus dicambivorans]
MPNRRVLIVHQNFPGQFGQIAQALLARGDQVAAIGGPTARQMEGVMVAQWSAEKGTTPGIYYQAVRAEADLIRATGAARAALTLQKHGFAPDVIVAHPAWGETLHLRTIFPDVPQLLFGELYYKARGLDSDFDPEFDQPSLGSDLRINAKNATVMLAYANADRIVCPTRFQAGLLPPLLQPLIETIHEGVDTDRAKRRPGAVLELPNGARLDGSTPVITFINRRFERLRGFHVFMRALPEFLAACPEAQVVLIGEEKGVSYGGPLPDGQEWKDRMLAEVGDRLDLSRVHFLGRVEHSRMVDALSISWGHVYYTYPFVLSWSLLEAMACECLIIGSDTAPVRELVQHGANGVLCDFFDIPALTAAMVRAVREPQAFAAMRKAARETVVPRYDGRRTGVPAWLELIDRVALRR